MLRVRRFGDAQLERLYAIGQWRQCATQLTVVLCALTFALLLVALNHLARPGLALLWAVGSAALALGLIIRLNVLSFGSNSQQHNNNNSQHTVFTAPTIWAWTSAMLLCTIVAAGPLALLPTLATIFGVYTVLPCRGLWWSLSAGFSLSLAQLAALILNSDYSDAQTQQDKNRAIVEEVLANVLAHAWVNFIGAYIFCARNRLCRAAFLNARNALASQHDAAQQYDKMDSLLRASLPPHVIASVKSQLSERAPKIYVEHYAKVSVIFARLYGLQTVLDQISVQDSAQLLNDFHYRIEELVKRYNFIRIRSDAIVIVAGILQSEENDGCQRSAQACHFAKELIAIFRSFCDATTANVQLRAGVGEGALCCGIVGAQKWHYDVVGEAFDSAKRFESKAQFGSILVGRATNAAIVGQFVTERVDSDSWTVVGFRPSVTGTAAATRNDDEDGVYLQRSALAPALLFAGAQKRYSLVTIPQAVNRLLQSSAIAAAATGAKNTMIMAAAQPLNASIIADSNKQSPRNNNKNNKQRIRKSVDGGSKASLRNKRETLALNEQILTAKSTRPLMHFATLRFGDPQLELQYSNQIDRWLIPALTISVLFLVLNTFFQLLVLPRLVTTLLISVAGLLILFAALLLLYVKYFESFCQFVTRTTVGYTLTVLLVIVVLFLCVIVNMFSCATLAQVSGACSEVHYGAAAVALWSISTVIFIRFGFFRLLCLMAASHACYGAYVFRTHNDLFRHYSEKKGWHVEYDIIVALLTLSFMILAEVRRNERMLRLDFLSVLKTLEESNRLERLEFLNEQIVFSALPYHIAHNYLTRSEPYQHLYSSVGVLCAQVGQSADWQTEFDFDRLNRVVFAFDQTLAANANTITKGAFNGVEKIRSAHCVYSCAVGVLPEVSTGKNVSDAPCTIGDLLATLSDFALKLKQLANDEGLDITIGIDCGPALSYVIGREEPQYDLVGAPCERAAQLINYAFVDKTQTRRAPSILVSEDVFLALRPRVNAKSFCFCKNETSASGMVCYALLEKQSAQELVQRHSGSQQTPEANHPVKERAHNVEDFEANVGKSAAQNQILLQRAMNSSSQPQQQHKQCAKQSRHSYAHASPTMAELHYDRAHRYSYQPTEDKSERQLTTKKQHITKQQNDPKISSEHLLTDLPLEAAKTTLCANGRHVQHRNLRLSPADAKNFNNNENREPRTGAVAKETLQNSALAFSIMHESHQAQCQAANECVTESLMISPTDSNAESSLNEAETDFDEIDERVAAAACARENVNRRSGLQCAYLPDESYALSSTLPTNDFPANDESFELPTDLRSLANDVRISGVFSYTDAHERTKRNDNLASPACIDQDKSLRLAEKNPFEMFASMNSSFSSELYSVDVSVESDSEIEWITPEMISYDAHHFYESTHSTNNNNNNINNTKMNNNNKAMKEKSQKSSSRSRLNLSRPTSRQKHSSMSRFIDEGARATRATIGLHGRQYSDQFSDQVAANRAEWDRFSPGIRRRRFRLSRNGPKLPSWLANRSRSSLGSSQQIIESRSSQRASYSALDRLNAAAQRVDKMLQELANVDDSYSLFNARQRAPECAPFPLFGVSSSVGASTNALVEYGAPRRELSSTCHTEYDNADSEDVYSEPELMIIAYGNRSQPASANYSETQAAKKSEGAKNKCKLTLAQKLRRQLSGFSEENVSFASGVERANFLPPSFAPSSTYTSTQRLPPWSRQQRATYNSAATAKKSSSGPARPSSKAKFRGRLVGAAYEADIDSNCSSLASSLMFLNASGFKKNSTHKTLPFSRLRQNSVHSIGYDNEYELASESEYCGDSDFSVLSPQMGVSLVSSFHDDFGAFDPTTRSSGVESAYAGGDSFVAIDADDGGGSVDGAVKATNSAHQPNGEAGRLANNTSATRNWDALDEMRMLSRDIRLKFGDYQLANFSET